MKRPLGIILSIALLLCAIFPFAAYATGGDGNMDGGGGDMGDGTNINSWNPGNDGVRVTVVRASDHAVVTTPIDFTNKSPTNVRVHFGKVSKLSYNSGNALTPSQSAYSFINPVQPIPRIISTNGNNNIEAVKKYFCSEYTVQMIANHTGIDYDVLIGGEYKLLIEPIAYYKFKGEMIATTATEAALYDETVVGQLRHWMGSLTAENLPLSMFLETPDLGYPAWDGSRTGIRSNAEIISSLGLGTVRFRDSECCGHSHNCPCITNTNDPTNCNCKTLHPMQPCGPDTPGCDCTDTLPPDTDPPDSKRYEYRTDTEVITTVTVRNNGSKGISPDDHATVTFNINGANKSKAFVVPPNEETDVWVRWHTPSEPQTVNISVFTSHGNLDSSTVICEVGELTENTPPDPRPTDKPPYSFNVPRKPISKGLKTLSWGEWLPRWEANWQWIPDWDWVSGDHNAGCSESCDIDHGEWEDNGMWKDLGKWEYDWKSYSAQLDMEVTVTPSYEAQNATAFFTPATGEWEMKSGYGILADVQARVYTSGGSRDVTVAQNAVSYFPEFDYEEYFRVMDSSMEDGKTTFAYAYNKYSFVGASVHYTPLWFPDNSEYAPKITVFDVWTPAGQLYYTDSNYLNINGDCYDDWDVVPVYGEDDE